MKTPVEINKSKSISVELVKNMLHLDGQLTDFRIKHLLDNQYLAYHDDQVYEIDVISSADGSYQLKINGVAVDAEVIDHQKQILKDLGMSNMMAEEVIDEIKSPMPGTIIDIVCKQGDSVNKGDTILILEAMKMENVIKSPAPGIIMEIKVTIGQNVEKNQSLVVF
ncbi:MAG: biotin carboxyl carrier protein [Cyclobacteriaceae bacterium]|jgi:biotin carboxyl carrier protein